MGSVTIRMQTLSVAEIFTNPAGFYVLGYGWLFGQTIWVSFIGGVIAHRSLTRANFTTLQSKLFPAFFSSSIFLSGGLMGLWSMTHPDALENLHKPLVVDVLQLYLLGGAAALNASQYFFIGPATNKIITDRQRQEREEGKNYNDPNVSDALKQLNKQFGMWHGISSLLNLFVVIGLTLHGLVLGTYGLRSY
ncbi:hypothetical protein BKA62DRAFT_694141 [Auriculariales sp. MPI-PUGE-AT-0066]|nr:hypothetical protein BKA62DRAFT_694141 [Auriculariales sp. MPI-PUGE-AT-0066]